MNEPEIHISSAFVDFQDKESASYQPPKSRNELVKPSGSLSSALAFNFHYPSFTSRNIMDGELADHTNPCIALAMNKGFDHSNVFWMNTFSRRESRGYGEKINFHDLYPPDTFQLHQKWITMLYDNLAAKVVVVFGQDNHRAITKRYRERLDNLELWGPVPITVRLLYAEESHVSIQRIFVHVHHTEHFLHNWTVEAGIMMDTQLNSAAALAKVAVKDPHYFEARAKNHTLSSKAQPKGFISTIIQLSQLETDGAVFTWDELPLTSWVQKCFKVTSETEFWQCYQEEFNPVADYRKDRDPTPAERNALEAIKSRPANRLTAGYPARKNLPLVPDIQPFVRKSGYFTSASRLHEIPESKGGLSSGLIQFLTLADSKQKKAQNERDDIGLASAIHRLVSRKAGLESSKRRWSSESTSSEEVEDGTKRQRF